MATYQQFDAPSWVTNSQIWNRPLLGGTEFPGIAYFQPVELSEATSDKKSNGEDGGSVVLQGLKTPRFEIVLHIITAEHERNWDKLAKTLISKANPENRGQYSIYHPSLARLGITNCVFERVVEDPPTVGGPLVVRLRFIAVSAIKPKQSKAFQKTSLELPQSIDTNYQKKQAENLWDINNPARKKIEYK